jgi:hypothetical protein
MIVAVEDPDLEKVKGWVTIREDGCWVDWEGSINNTNQPVAWLEGRTQAVKPWLKRRYCVLRPTPCRTKGCLSPLHGDKGAKPTL